MKFSLLLKCQILFLFLLICHSAIGQHLHRTHSNNGLFKIANDSTLKSGTSHGLLVKLEIVRFIPLTNRYVIKGTIVDASSLEALPDFTIYHGIRTAHQEEFKLYRKWKFHSTSFFRIKLNALPMELLIFDTSMPLSAEEFQFNISE